jgi:hypothetical protein
MNFSFCQCVQCLHMSLFSRRPNRLTGPHSLLLNSMKCSFLPQVKRPGMKLTDHLHLILKLRLSGVYFQSSYDFMSYTWAILLLNSPNELTCHMTHTSHSNYKASEDGSCACQWWLLLTEVFKHATPIQNNDCQTGYYTRLSETDLVACSILPVSVIIQDKSKHSTNTSRISFECQGLCFLQSELS